jgi:putative ABC transport system permease protein
MLFMIPLSYNLRNLTVRKVTTLATAIGIGLVVFVFAAVLMLSNGIQRMLGTTGRPDNVIVLSKGSDAELSSTVEKDKAGLLLQKPEVAHDDKGAPLGVSELVVVLTMPKLGTDGISNVTVRGVEANTMAFRPEVKIVRGRAAQPGTEEVMVGQKIAGRFKGLDLGQSFELRKNRPATVVGIFSANNSVFESEVWGDIDTFRAVFNRPGVASSMRVRLAAASKFDAFNASIKQDKALGLEVQREDVYYDKQSEGLSLFINILGIFIAVFFSFGAMIGAMITMYGSISTRRREIGTLRALGFSRIGILLSFLFESIVLALLGGVIGVVASLAMGMVSFSMVNFATWSEVIFKFEPTPGIIVSAFVFAAIMGTIGGFFPALRAAYTSPIEAMRN